MGLALVPTRVILVIVPRFPNCRYPKISPLPVVRKSQRKLR